jgi:hypothetical protein
MATIDAAVEKMRAGTGNVFVIGAPEQERLTVCSQQTRALNLICWLNKRWREEKLTQTENGKPDLVVIGAGIAGLTAAAAAACLGKKVWVFEAHEHPLALQRGCRHRLLHPHFYEWPAVGCWKMSAGLPILDWEEGSATEVADRIWGQFKAIEDKTDITMYTSVPDVQVKGLMENPYVTWTNSGGQLTTVYPPVVILAVGFGVERTVPDLPVLSYWRDDPLDQAPLSRRRRGEYTQIVSGTGDGGLVDVLRAALNGFDHVQFFSSVAAITRASVLEKYLLKVESELAGKTRQQAADFLAKHYNLLDEVIGLSDEAIDREDVSPELYEAIQSFEPQVYAHAKLRILKNTLKRVEDLIRAHRRKNHKVIWLYQDESPWNWKTMCLNRFLISRVMHVDENKNLVQPKRGTLLTSKLIDPTVSNDFSFVAYVQEKPGAKLEALTAHGVTVRHGANPALDEFPDVAKAWKKDDKDEVEESDRLKTTAFWEDDPGFKSKLDEFKPKQIPSSDTPDLLRVRIVEPPNPIEVEDKNGNVCQRIYRLIAYLHNPPLHVWRVTYDLRPSWGRMERPVTRDESLTDMPFAKLLHTDTGVSETGESYYEVRIRLNDGSETTTNLVCAICREYCKDSKKSEGEKERARTVVNALCGGRDNRPCKGKACVLG